MSSPSCTLVVILLSLQLLSASGAALRSLDGTASRRDEAVVPHRNVPKETANEDLASADNLGIPSNGTRQLEQQEEVASTTQSIMTKLAHPLVALAKFKATALRELLLLPYRIITVPVKVFSQTREAIRLPFDVKRWGQVSADLTRFNATKTTE